MLEFFNAEPTVGVVNIYDSYITFNKSLANYLDDAYRVRIGIDRAGKKVYFFKLNKDSALSNEYDEKSLLKVGITKTYARVCSKQLIDFIADAFNIIINKKEFKRYQAAYSASDKAIIIDMEGELR